MAISYVVDVYHRRFPLASWIDVTLYLSFFPHLVAGPIVRPDELIPQLDVRRDARHVDVVGAGWLILGGLFKKVVIANYLATAIVDQVFNEPAPTRMAGDPRRHRRLRRADLLRLQRLHRHRDRDREAARVPVPAELRPSLQRALDPGVLAPLAHDAVALAARLPLHPARWEPQGHRPHLRQPDDHDAARRSVARRGVALRGLGRTARGLPRDRSMEAVAAGARGPRSRAGRALGVCAAGARAPSGSSAWPGCSSGRTRSARR